MIYIYVYIYILREMEIKKILKQSLMANWALYFTVFCNFFIHQMFEKCFLYQMFVDIFCIKSV